MAEGTAAFGARVGALTLGDPVQRLATCRQDRVRVRGEAGVGRPRPPPRRLLLCAVSASPDGEVGLPDGQSPPTLPEDPLTPDTIPSKRKSKLFRRVSVGFLLGAVVIVTVFSGPWIFALAMAVACILGQQEYYQMAMARGHLPATRLGRSTTALIMLVSVLNPSAAEAVFAIGGTYICCYLLFRRRPRQATIADVSTTFMGLFYAGYLPNFWVRLHHYTFPVTYLAPGAQIVSTAVAWTAKWLPFALSRPLFHSGAVMLFWSWLANAFADIGAFFTGRSFGRTRLSHISPKKTVEGALGGLFCSTSISMAGAYLMGWPAWYLTGACYGIMVGVIGPLGDLTESLFKRDAGIKDSGDLIPGHGGILDRTDSYVFIAPIAYYFATYLLPAIRRFASLP